MLVRFTTIFDELCEESQQEDASIQMNQTNTLYNEAERYKEMLSEIDFVTKSLHLRGRTPNNCRRDLDTLINTIQVEENKRRSPIFGSILGRKYIAQNSDILESRIFEHAVAKIQKE